MMSESGVYHIPALLNETINLLDIKPDGVYVDCTFGGGGHSRAILERLGPEGRLFGFDRDMDAYSNAPDDKRFTFVHGDFRYIQNYLEYYGYERVDGILADLGVSFHHFDTPERGFSFRSEGPLDMRMNRNSTTTAKHIINTYPEAKLAELLTQHTDLRNAKALARKICDIRTVKEIETTTELADAISPLLNQKTYKKELAQLFQAIRIATNDEMTSLDRLLEKTPFVLKEKGRMAVLTYHSGEDRKVKEFFKTGSLKPVHSNEALIYGKNQSPWKLITNRPIIASEDEVNANPRSRSAKLRVAELLKESKE